MYQVDALVRRSGNIGIQVLSAETVESEPGSRLGSAQRPPFSPEPYFIATTLVVLATAIGYIFDRQIDLPNISMICLRTRRFERSALTCLRRIS